MREVVLEVQDGRRWARLSAVAAGGPPGSISNQEPHGRQVYVFGWLGEEGPGVWRSIGGMDIDTPLVRLITNTDGFEALADLVQGPHELDFVRHGRPMRIRFRLEEA